MLITISIAILMSIFQTLFMLPILSFFLVFNKEKTIDSIFVITIIGLSSLFLLTCILNLKSYDVDLAISKSIEGLTKSIIPYIISMILIIKYKLYNKIWFSKILPWIGGIFVVLFLIIFISIMFMV